MKTWKVAIVGCGDIAENVYMPQMPRNRRAQVVACCDLKPERTALFQQKFGIPEAYGNIDELLAQCDFDILMDTASIPAHYELNMAALRAGKHLYSQKPVGLTVAQVDDMIHLAQEKGLKFSASPIHMLRPDIRQAQALIQSGAIGQVLWASVYTGHGGPEYFQYRVNDPTWFYRPGAGALYDLGVHALTMVTGLLGPAQRVSCVAATAQPLRPIRSGAHDGKVIEADQLFDNYLIQLDFGGGQLSAVDTGYCMKASKRPSLEVYGEEGTISFTDNPNGPLNVYVDSPRRGIRGWMQPMPQIAPTEDFYQCSCIRDLYEAIEQDREVVLRPEHARHVVDLMVQIEEATRDHSVHTLEITFDLT